MCAVANISLKHRPVLINNWEGTYFDFDEEKLYQIAKNASKIGIEMLVMDDGWFGKRDSDFSGLGDWFVNENKIHGGLKKLVDRINGLGMKFGIWCRTRNGQRRQRPVSGLIRNGACAKRTALVCAAVTSLCWICPGRMYGIICLTRMKDILSSANIEYVKWDMNRHLANVWSELLPSDRQGEVYHRFMLGVYDLLERITSAFPHVAVRRLLRRRLDGLTPVCCITRPRFGAVTIPMPLNGCLSSTVHRLGIRYAPWVPMCRMSPTGVPAAPRR